MRKLVFFVGPAGAGKTTLAKALARRRGTVLLDMDTLLRPAAETIMRLSGLDPDDRDSPVYKARCRDLGYRITMDAALENLELGLDVLVIGPFTQETGNPDWIGQELARIGATLQDVSVKVVSVRLPAEEDYYRRIEARGSALDLWKLENWAAFRRSLAPREVLWPLASGSLRSFDNAGELTSEKLEELEAFVYG